MKNICEKLIHIYMVVYIWWCWHIYKGEVGVDVDQLGEETESKHVTGSDRTLHSVATGLLLASPVMCSSEGAGVVLRPDAERRSDLTRKDNVRSMVTQCDVARAAEAART